MLEHHHLDPYRHCLLGTARQRADTIVRSNGGDGSRMRRWRVIFIALLLAGTCLVPAFAQSPQALFEMAVLGDGPVLVVPILIRFADLTDAQTDQVRQIFDAGRPRVQHLLGQLADANNTLAEALLAPPGMRVHDAGAIVKRLARLRLELMQEELTTVRAIRKILTPVQFAKVSAAMDALKKASPPESLTAERTF